MKGNTSLGLERLWGCGFLQHLTAFCLPSPFLQGFSQIRASHKTNLHHSSRYKELFLPKEVLREVTREASGMKRCCWQSPKQLKLSQAIGWLSSPPLFSGKFWHHHPILHEGLHEEINQGCSLITEKILAFHSNPWFPKIFPCQG